MRRASSLNPYSKHNHPMATPPPSLEKALREAIEMFEQDKGDLSSYADKALPAHIIRILPEAQQIAESKVPDMQRRLKAIEPLLEKAIVAASSTTLSRKARFTKLRESATALNKALMPITACSKGSCSHCCHIPVGLFESEAAIIGEAIGKKPARVSRGSEMSTEFGYHLPCPFLKANKCSIYEHRPVACRLYLSMDESDRLCVLLPDTTVPVPLVDTRQFQMAYVEAGVGEKLADIREFFPNGAGK